MCPGGARTPLTTLTNGLTALALPYLQPRRSSPADIVPCYGDRKQRIEQSDGEQELIWCPSARARPCVFLH